MHELVSAENLSPTESVEARIQKDISYLKETYGIDVKQAPPAEEDIDEFRKFAKVSGFKGEVSVNIIPLITEEQCTALDMIKQELKKYPQEYLENCELKELRLFKAVVMRDSADPNSAYLASGLSITGDKKKMYLSTTGEGPFSLPPTFHHELFHFSDKAHINKLASKDPRNTSNELIFSAYQFVYDCEWEELEKRSKLLSELDPFAVNSMDAPVDSAPEGFALDYGMLDAWEDRATTAGMLMYYPSRAFKKAEKDQVFSAKMNRVMAYYEERSNGKMNRKFFEDLAERKVGEDYWKKRSDGHGEGVIFSLIPEASHIPQ